MKTIVNPIFIFSLPRAGSTLLQRILAADENIATTSEPWIMLPFIYVTKTTGEYAEYGHRRMVEAVTDFFEEMPQGMVDFRVELRRFALSLYQKAAAKKPGARYFIDKTPRYHLVAQEIIDLYPEGKFVFLWRNPVAVAASIIETFGAGQWVLYAYNVDLFLGLNNLIRVFEANPGRVCAVRYEDLVSRPDVELEKICDYLDIQFNRCTFEVLRNDGLNGRMGDPTGIHKYTSVSDESLGKWKRTLHNGFRKMWFKRYIKSIGAERLAIMGYEMEDIINEIESVPTGYRKLGSDISRFAYGLAEQLLELRILADKAQSKEWIDVVSHR